MARKHVIKAVVKNSTELVALDSQMPFNGEECSPSHVDASGHICSLLVALELNEWPTLTLKGNNFVGQSGGLVLCRQER